MIQMQTRLKVADNSGAKEVMFIRALGGGIGKIAYIGDVFVGSVKTAEPNSKIKKGEVVGFAGLMGAGRTDNAAVVIDKQGEPVGTRVFGPVARELREKRFMKIVSLAPEVI